MTSIPGLSQLIHADGKMSGASEKVDFEDWKPVARSREVHFLRPDGKELDVKSDRDGRKDMVQSIPLTPFRIYRNLILL